MLAKCLLNLVAVVLLTGVMAGAGGAEVPRALPEGQLPADARLGPLRTLNSYFPFRPVESVDQWHHRAAELRRQVLVATGLWPMPEKTPLKAVVHSPVERDDYTVSRVYFESLPGHFVTGSLYQPTARVGKLPAVLTPHGHWRGGRFHEYNFRELKEQISIGAERFLSGGRYPLQARCVQLARMGCVVFHYDMVGYADSVQLEHRPGVRESMNTPTDWGYFSPQAELHLQNMMGLQTWNSIRALDFLAALPNVDPERIAVTGASGGGTQTFLLLAVDDRPRAAAPMVMVSTAMQGGCSCENAPYLRIGAGNIDLAALAAPRGLALSAADDWTRELRTKGLPALESLYTLLGHKDRLRAVDHVHFKHNYNSVNRMFVYSAMNDFLGLGHEKPILERDYLPLTREELTVWTDDHPRPAGQQVGDAHERRLLGWWTDHVGQQIESLRDDPEAYEPTVGGGWDVLIGRRLEDVGEVSIEEVRGDLWGDYRGQTLLINAEAAGEQLPALLLYPGGSWNGQVIIWLTDRGKAGLLSGDGGPIAPVGALLNSGYAVVGVDLLYQGEFLQNDEPLTHARLNQPESREPSPFEFAAAFTFGYNRPLFSQRVHDVLTAVRAIETDPRRATAIHLVGLGREAGPIALAARSRTADVVEKTYVATAGFDFAALDRLDDPMFVPGAVKYDGVDALRRLAGDESLVRVDREADADTGAATAGRWIAD